MARDQTIAPKARINITFKPATGDAKEFVELPLKLMVLGDFLGREDGREIADRVPISVTKTNFDKVMAEQDLRLNLHVANRLSGTEGDEFEVNLAFKSLQDMQPDRVAAQVPAMAEMLELRKKLETARSYASIRQFRKELEAVIRDKTALTKLLEEFEKRGEQAGEK
jgi:type VI secretion system protein ImpB